MNGTTAIYSAWGVPEVGFRWISRQGRRWLVREPGTTSLRLYDPIQDHPALFRVFADLNPDEDAVVAFANEYGALGIPERADGAERLGAWGEQIARMRNVVALLDAADQGDVAQLERWITLRETAMGTSATFRRPETSSLETLRVGEDDRAGYLQPKNYELAARLLADKIISAELETETRVQMIYNPETRTHERCAVPVSLLGALWIQAGDLAEQRRDYQRCEICGTWFALSGDASRSDRRLCSNRCSAKAYRDRKEAARRLHEGGMSPSAIARKLGAKDTQTVRGWLGMKPTARGRRK